MKLGLRKQDPYSDQPQSRWPVVVVDVAAMLLFFIGMKHLAGDGVAPIASPLESNIEDVAWQISQISRRVDVSGELQRKLDEEKKELAREREHVRALEAQVKGQNETIRREEGRNHQLEMEAARYQVRAAQELHLREEELHDAAEHFAQGMSAEEAKVALLEAENNGLHYELSEEKAALEKLHRELADLRRRASNDAVKTNKLRGQNAIHPLGSAVHVRFAPHNDRLYAAVVTGVVDAGTLAYNVVRLEDGLVRSNVNFEEVKAYKKNVDGDEAFCRPMIKDATEYYGCTILGFQPFSLDEGIPHEAAGQLRLTSQSMNDIHGHYIANVHGLGKNAAIMRIPAMNVARIHA